MIIAQRYQFAPKSEELILNSKWSPIVEEGTEDIFDYLGEPDYQVSSPSGVKDPVKLYKKGEEECVIPRSEEGASRSNENSTYTIVNPSMLRVKSKTSDSHDGDDEEKAETIDRRYPRLLGTTVHRLMEIIVSSKGTMDEESAINEVVREFSKRTDSYLLEKLRTSLINVVVAMKNGGYAQTNDVPQDLLDVLRILKGMKWKEVERYESIHNYIGTLPDGTRILRKGAASACEGEMVIIPINMRDGVILGVGKGNPDWNYSAPHGSGRVLRRDEVKNHYTVSAFKNDMKGIYSSSIGTGTLDEAPVAYRGIDEIIDVVSDSVEVKEIVKPVYNFKAGKER